MIFPIASVTLRTSGSTCVKKSAMPLRSCSADITILSVEGRFVSFKRVTSGSSGSAFRTFSPVCSISLCLSHSPTFGISNHPALHRYTGSMKRAEQNDKQQSQKSLPNAEAFVKLVLRGIFVADPGVP